MTQRPYELGGEAYLEGMRLNENPYAKDSSAWQAWRDGFKVQQKQYRMWERSAAGKAHAALRERLTYKPRVRRAAR